MSPFPVLARSIWRAELFQVRPGMRHLSIEARFEGVGSLIGPLQFDKYRGWRVQLQADLAGSSLGTATSHNYKQWRSLGGENGGTLYLDYVGTIDNRNGTIASSRFWFSIQFNSGTLIQGGTLKTTNGGYLWDR